MYKDFYHLKKEPFHITPDPEFLYLSPSHKQALGSIIYGVKNRKGFIVITGEVGVGKTTILRSYLEGVAKQKTKIIYVFNANISFQNLLRIIYKELGLKAKTDDAVEMLDNLYNILMEEYRQGSTVLLIVDEAQNMPIETLESIRVLSNLETSKEKLIQIVLVGQPEFEQILNLHELRQLKQRIAIHSTIIPFTRKESMAYIEHRLTKAAANETALFTQKALKRIVKEAAGIPRNLNILCDNALITGFGYKMKPVNGKVVEEVLADFKIEKKPSLLKWAIAPAALLVFIAGLFLIYPHKGLILSGVENLFSSNKSPVISKTENQDPSRTQEPNPIQVEAKPSIDRPEISQAGPDTPTGQKIETSQVKKTPEPPKTPSPVVRTVRKGDNLFRLTKGVYGYADAQLVERVRRNNPWIKNINNIPIGEEIIFPENPQEQVKAKQ